jgi:hypothetical protein
MTNVGAAVWRNSFDYRSIQLFAAMIVNRRAGVRRSCPLYPLAVGSFQLLTLLSSLAVSLVFAAEIAERPKLSQLEETRAPLSEGTRGSCETEKKQFS